MIEVYLFFGEDFMSTFQMSSIPRKGDEIDFYHSHSRQHYLGIVDKVRWHTCASSQTYVHVYVKEI